MRNDFFIMLEYCFTVYDEELLHSALLCPTMMRYKLKRSLAAELVNELVDSVTHIRSNVRGRVKGQLDPKII